MLQWNKMNKNFWKKLVQTKRSADAKHKPRRRGRPRKRVVLKIKVVLGWCWCCVSCSVQLVFGFSSLVALCERPAFRVFSFYGGRVVAEFSSLLVFIEACFSDGALLVADFARPSFAGLSLVAFWPIPFVFIGGSKEAPFLFCLIW